jgi:hypothetical protein
MGRKLVDATNASRMRRTRGEIGLFLCFALAACVCAVAGFLVCAAPVAPVFGFAADDFVAAAL